MKQQLRKMYPFCDGKPIEGYTLTNESAGFDEYSLYENQYCLIFSFEGSGKEIKRWINNLAASTGDDEIHDGFQRSTQTIYQHMLLKGYISRIRENKKKVYFVGHSRGGAIAQLLLTLIDNAPNIDCFCYGAPMVTDDRDEFFRKNINFRRHLVVNVINGRDLVPRLPPKFEMLGIIVHLNLPAPTWHYLPWTLVQRHLDYPSALTN